MVPNYQRARIQVSQTLLSSFDWITLTLFVYRASKWTQEALKYKKK